MTNATRINFICPADLYAVIRAELARRLTANPESRINQSTIVIDALRAQLMAEDVPPEEGIGDLTDSSIWSSPTLLGLIETIDRWDKIRPNIQTDQDEWEDNVHKL